MWEEINEVVQAEPAEVRIRKSSDCLASIGIKKGQPFKPDTRMKKILAEAADVGAVTVRALTARPREDMYYYYPGESIWSTCFPEAATSSSENGVMVPDARAYFHFYATGITPAMAAKMVGKGSQYAVAYLDAEGNSLNGRQDLQGVTCHRTSPPRTSGPLACMTIRPITVADRPTVSRYRQQQGRAATERGRFLRHLFGPQAPQGKQSNWLQTIPARAGTCCSAFTGRSSPGSIRRGGRAIPSWWIEIAD